MPLHDREAAACTGSERPAQEVVAWIDSLEVNDRTSSLVTENRVEDVLHLAGSYLLAFLSVNEDTNCKANLSKQALVNAGG